MLFPPLEDGALKAIDNVCDADGVTEVMVGAVAIVEGIAVVITLASPLPLLFTALSEMSYEVPLVRPVIVNGDDVDAGERVTQFVPPSSEY